MNLRKQVEPLLSAAHQASSNRGVHTARPRGSLGLLRWLRRASENHHEQSRSLSILLWHLGTVKAREQTRPVRYTARFAATCASASSTKRSRRIARSCRSPLLTDC
jgi:hypothetical protein